MTTNASPMLSIASDPGPTTWIGSMATSLTPVAVDSLARNVQKPARPASTATATVATAQRSRRASGLRPAAASASRKALALSQRSSGDQATAFFKTTASRRGTLDQSTDSLGVAIDQRRPVNASYRDMPTE